MRERGAALVEMLIVTAIAGLIWAVAVRVLADLPAQASAWEEAAASRQGLRVIEARLARLTAGVEVIALNVDGRDVRIPALWPRRLGFFRPGAPGDVSARDVTILSRVDGHRSLTLASALGAAGAGVEVSPRPGCGSAALCGFREGDFVLAAARDGECGLFRVTAADGRLDLAPLTQPGRDAFPPGSVLVPIVIDAIAFDEAEGALRRYDGYRSDNILVDGLRRVTVTAVAAQPVVLGDGPFIGSGTLAYDADQRSLIGIDMLIEPAGAARAGLPDVVALQWRVRAWP